LSQRKLLDFKGKIFAAQMFGTGPYPAYILCHTGFSGIECAGQGDEWAQLVRLCTQTVENNVRKIREGWLSD